MRTLEEIEAEMWRHVKLDGDTMLDINWTNITKEEWNFFYDNKEYALDFTTRLYKQARNLRSEA